MRGAALVLVLVVLVTFADIRCARGRWAYRDFGRRGGTAKDARDAKREETAKGKCWGGFMILFYSGSLSLRGGRMVFKWPS